VATTVAHSGDIGIYVNALGVVTPRNTVSVKSRVDGQLVKVNYQEGQNPMLVVTELQPITVIFNVAEDYLPQIQQQLRAGKTLPVDAFDRAQTKKLATGTLQTLDNQIDTTTGTLKLRAVFPNEDESLFPNQFVNARLLVDTLHNATLVPNTVVQRNAESAFVYLLKPDQTVAMQTITVGTTDGNASAVEGIVPGAVVAADNFNRLTDGAKVVVRPSTNAASRAEAPNKASQKNLPPHLASSAQSL
jgi:multidrug efflux system membrane fusion protein